MKENPVISILKKNLIKIQSFGINKIALFGSYAQGKQTENSDIDILIEFEEGKKILIIIWI